MLLGAALGVITSRNPVFSALFLVLAFVTSAVLWLLLEAEFLAMTLVLAYYDLVVVNWQGIDDLWRTVLERL